MNYNRNDIIQYRIEKSDRTFLEAKLFENKNPSGPKHWVFFVEVAIRFVHELCKYRHMNQ